MKPNGFSLIELMVVGGISAGLAVGIAGTLANQQKALRGLYAKIEIQTIRTNIAEILKDEANCTATIQAVSPSVPNLDQPINITQVLVRREINGEVQIRPFYETNKLYDAGVKIREMRVRPNIPQRDATPGPKFEMVFEVSAKIIGPNEFTRKLEFFSSPIATVAFPDYAFKCGLGSAASIVGGGTTVTPPVTAGDDGADGADGESPELTPISQSTSLGCPPLSNNSFRTASITCLDNKKAISCSVQDMNANEAEDKHGYYVDIPSRTCHFQVDKEEGCDNLTAHCVCL